MTSTEETRTHCEAPGPQQHVQATEEHEIRTETVFPRWLWTGMCVAGVFLYGSYAVLVTLSKEDGKIPYTSSHLVLLIEALKLLLSFIMYFPEFYKNGFRFPSTSYTTMLCFAVPAVFYSINNNLAIHMLMEMDPTTFEVLSKMKIITTALLYKLIIKREITTVQWIALSILLSAGICDSYGGFHDSHPEDAFGVFITTKGLVMMTVLCLISGFAAVYTEYILKKNVSEPLQFQNIMMYSFGIVVNGGASIWKVIQSNDSIVLTGFCTGFNVYTWLIVLTQALNGLIIAVVFKYGSNITRLFIIASAMVTATLMSVFILGTVINVFFVVAALLVGLALYLYNI